MRQLIPEIPIYPGSGNSAEQSHHNNGGAGSDLRKQRSGAGSGNRPAKTEDQSAIDLAFVEFFFMEDDFFAINGFNPEFLNQKY